MKATFLQAILMSTLLLPVTLLRAQALYPVSIAEKVKHSTHILEGTVESQSSFWNQQHTMIYTSSKVRVHKVFAGQLSPDFIEVLTQGGAVENMSIEVSDLLKLEPGATGMFFCYPNALKLVSPVSKQVLYDVYSSSQGFYSYDVLKMSASVPFDEFPSITKGLYPAITSLTGHSYIEKDPAVSFVEAPATTGVSLMAVTSFSPTVVYAGAFLVPASNLVTISGTGFGTPTGSAAILFDDADNGAGGTPYLLSASSSLITSWTDTEIKVKIPARVGTGYFSVRKSDNSLFTSAQPLIVQFAVLSATFAGDHILQPNLMSANGQGGYDIVYSTTTLNGGRDLSTAPEKTTFQRALTTWKEICGANIREAGTTTSQQVDGNDALNIILLDNNNSGVAPLADGVLAITYNYFLTCLANGQYTLPGVKTGFDMVIRNPGVSLGNTNLTLGPCPPATNIVQSDLETILLHELGHALNLAHVNDSYEGTQLPNVNPAKVMNYSIPNGVKRVSPDYAAKAGADYTISNKGLTFGNCGIPNLPMVPLPRILEAKDECPLSFPVGGTLVNTQVTFDLEHATSNAFVDPQYTNINCTGLGTGVTNTAYTVVKTNTAGSLTITVSGYSTVPPAQQNCSVAGVEMALYKVNSCPVGQNFPTPVACRVFNGNGVLSSITGLTANSTYLLMVDGISNTKANFSLTFNGSVLPVKLAAFFGTIASGDNTIHWEFDALSNISKVNLERSTDGFVFETINSWRDADFVLKSAFTDKQAPEKSYYRLKFETLDGKEEYSNVINLFRAGKPSWTIYPNPAKNTISVYASNAPAGRYHARLFTGTGQLVSSRFVELNTGMQRIQVPSTGLSFGNYRLVVTNSSGENVFSGNVTVAK